MKQKRGQITVFIILGIIILLSILLFVYFREAVTVFKPERVIPPELEPLNEFVEGCLNQIARDGINILGANGGFIRFPDEIRLDPGASLSNPLFPSIKVPLWHHRGQTQIPSEAYMEADLAFYIDQNLGECLNNLEEFREQYQIEELGGRATEVVFSDTGVEIVLDYPIEVTSLVENQTTTLPDFIVSVPIRVRTTYELAKRVMEEELTDKFIELRTIDLIALDGDIPYTSMEFTCTPKIWYLSDVKEKLQKVLSVNMPLIRVEKTDYPKIPKDQEYIKNHYVWQVTDLNYPKTHVSFSYDENWPMDLHVSPNEGLFLRSNAQRGFDLMSFFCMHMWHFTYDVKFPVMTTITDEAAKNHESFTFNFAFETGINHNVPDKTSFGITTFDFEQKARSEQFCVEANPSTVLRVNTFENVSTPDGELYDEVDGVNVSFTCIRFNCPIGQTEYKFGGAVATLTADVPYCVNGVVRGEKEDYESTFKFVTTDTEKAVDLYLTPTITKDIEVVKHRVFRDKVDPAEPLDNDESAIITIKRKGFKSSAIYPSTEETLESLKFLGNWNYEYQVEIYLADDRTILGGYMGNWTVRWGDLKGARKLKFHVVEYPFHADLEKQFEYILELPGDTKKIPGPEFLI
ncbi:MAG: hypothetical protein V3V78_05330 [Candidatus Woesearchaeota archaeon]